MTKSSLRSKYKKKRTDLSIDKIDDLSIEIANQSLKLPIWDNDYYHLFLQILKQKEVNTDYILHILQGKDKHIVLSKSDFEKGSLMHYLLTDRTHISINEYGIPEPVNGIKIAEEQLDVIFVPLLAFDISGNRLGYGKGFYDRFLSRCKSEALKIGLSLFEPEEQLPQITPNDIALDYCVTPYEIYDFRS